MRAKRTIGLIGLLIGATGAYAAATTVKKLRDKTTRSASRWHAVTVNIPIDDVPKTGSLPEPLRKIEDLIEIRVQAAPNGKGTEIAACLKDTPSQIVDARRGLRKVRAALRKTKMLLETGEVLQPDKRSSTPPTPLNMPLHYLARHGYGEGRV